MIDDLDKKVLSFIQEDASMAIEALGEEAGLSATAAKRRLNKLRENGTIRKSV